jgi:hypothetical protein
MSSAGRKGAPLPRMRTGCPSIRRQTLRSDITIASSGQFERAAALGIGFALAARRGHRRHKPTAKHRFQTRLSRDEFSRAAVQRRSFPPPTLRGRAIVFRYGQILSALYATLPLLGQLQPLVRKLFVAPLAFLVPAVGEILVFFRARSFRLVPGRAATRCEEVRRHGDLHLPLTFWSLVRLLR